MYIVLRITFHRLPYHTKILYNNQPNKAKLRDLISATGLVILLKLDSNRQFVSLCYLKIRWTTSTNNRTHLLHYIKLCASFQIHWWIQSGVTVWKSSIRVKIGHFLSHVTLKFHEWASKTIRHLFYTTSILAGVEIKGSGRAKCSLIAP